MKIYYTGQFFNFLIFFFGGVGVSFIFYLGKFTRYFKECITVTVGPPLALH